MVLINIKWSFVENSILQENGIKCNSIKINRRENNVTAEVLDMQGRVVVPAFKLNSNEQAHVPVSNLPEGLYTVRVYGDDYIAAKRVFVGK